MCDFDNMQDEKNTQLVIAYTIKKSGNAGVDFGVIEDTLMESGIPINRIRVRNAVRTLNSNGFIMKRGSRYYASFKLNNMAKPMLCG
jgi:hypothetical protein